MAAIVTERWHGDILRIAVDLSTWYARREFDVVQAANKADALAAVQAQFGVGPNLPHNLNPLLRCYQFEATPDPGLTVHRVSAEYHIPPGGDVPANPNPLLQPAKLRWVPGLISEPFEIDANGTPVLNAAGDPLDTPPNLDSATWSLIVRRNEPFYDPSRVSPYIGNINSDVFFIRSGGGHAVRIDKGQARCMSIMPAGEYTLTATFVPVEYVFQFRPSLPGSGVPADAWDVRIKNWGYNGWYNSNGTPKKDEFWRNGSKVSTPVLMDETGKPYDSSVTVKGQTPIANPARLQNPRVFFEYRNLGQGQTVVYLHYNRGRRVRFNGIL